MVQQLREYRAALSRPPRWLTLLGYGPDMEQRSARFSEIRVGDQVKTNGVWRTVTAVSDTHLTFDSRTRLARPPAGVDAFTVCR
ncbi:hypothetical protein [Gordonia caeni]|uniref:Uncharacterized protein n=1 Tax=Gordonia caeni TaxID=1007097 RepID=A0ABP7PR42_9ACTN